MELLFKFLVAFPVSARSRANNDLSLIVLEDEMLLVSFQSKAKLFSHLDSISYLLGPHVAVSFKRKIVS